MELEWVFTVWHWVGDWDEDGRELRQWNDNRANTNITSVVHGGNGQSGNGTSLLVESGQGTTTDGHREANEAALWNVLWSIQGEELLMVLLHSRDILYEEWVKDDDVIDARAGFSSVGSGSRTTVVVTVCECDGSDDQTCNGNATEA